MKTITRFWSRTALAAVCLAWFCHDGSAVQRSGNADQPVGVAAVEDLEYPREARAADVQGVVVIRVELDRQGRVASASALSGSRRLIAATLENIKQWRFRNKEPIQTIVVYDFRIEGRCRAARPTMFRLVEPDFASVTTCRTDEEVSR